MGCRQGGDFATRSRKLKGLSGKSALDFPKTEINDITVTVVEVPRHPVGR
jgi:hypothetical protein